MTVYLIHRHGDPQGSTYTDDIDAAQRGAAEWALKNPGRRAEVAELIFGYQTLKGGQHFETIHKREPK